MLDSFQMLFAYNSGVIENKEITYYDVRKIFANGKVINFTGDLRTLYEITNQKDCAEYLINKLINKEPLSVEFIKKYINYLLRVPTMKLDITKILNGQANLINMII